MAPGSRGQAPAHLRPEDAAYPTERLAAVSAPELTLLGEAQLLRRPLVALLCSRSCPGELILKTYDLARRLRDQGICVISGFHTPMEKEALHFLLKGRQPIIIAPARSLQGMRIPTAYRQPLAQGRLLLVSASPAGERRVTAGLAAERNRLVGALADRILVIYAQPGGQLERTCAQFVAWGKPIAALASKANEHLAASGITLSEQPWPAG